MKTDQPGLVRLSVLVVFVLSMSLWIVMRLPLWPAAVVVQGLLLVSLFHLLHETVHDTPFATPVINRVVAGFAGFTLFLPPTWFRYFHHAHHRYTQNPQRDPELQSAKPASKKQWLWHVSGLGIWKAQAEVLWLALRQPCTDEFVPARHRQSVRREMWVMLATYAVLLLASLLFQSTLLLQVWLLPLLVGQPFLRLYLLAEHAGCDHSPDMFSNTRTVFSHPLVKWFAWNMPYHTEHHVYPTVPFHQLPVLHKLMKGHLIHSERGYVSFNRRFHRELDGSQDTPA